jgi:hypothetical protein
MVVLDLEYFSFLQSSQHNKTLATQSHKFLLIYQINHIKRYQINFHRNLQRSRRSFFDFIKTLATQSHTLL